MRFSELHLIRYGQFDGCLLSFPQSTSDLHVVYGPNEAGKSTTMAAIADLLFGFPHAAAYDFRFDKLLLRVGGVLEGREEPLVCRRKRGNSRTLLNPAEQPIDEGPLTALLAGQTRESFLRAFSLDHARLRDGGRSMLEAKDDVGQAIFAAGAGLVGVTRLVEALESEARGIWADRAKADRSYYIAQKSHDEARARLRETQVKSAHWAEMKKALEGRERELQELRSRRDSLQTELQRAERRRRTLTPIARRAQLLTDLETLGPVADLPEDARRLFEQATGVIADNETKARLAREHRESAKAGLAGLTYDPNLLKRRDDVTALRAQQGAVNKALRDTPNLKTKAEAARAELQRLLAEVGWPDSPARDVQERLPGRPQVSALRDLLEQHRQLISERDTAASELKEQGDLVEELRAQLGQLPDTQVTTAFTAVLKGVRAEGDLDAAASAALRRHDKAKRALETALASLAPWRGDAQALTALLVPADSEIDRLAEALKAADQDLLRAEQALIQLRDDRHRVELRRSQLLKDEHAISVDMLEGARGKRDATWQEISAHLSGVSRSGSPEAARSRFDGELRTADELADRRFEGAKTSASLVTADQELQRLDLDLVLASQRHAAAEQRATSAQAEWATAIASVGGRMTPEAFRAWRSERLRAIDLGEAERTEAEEAARLAGRVVSARQQLSDVLPSGTVQALKDASLATLVQAAVELESAAHSLRERIVGLEGRIQAAETAHRRAERRRDDAHNSLEAWRRQWIAALQALQLDSAASLPVVRGRLEMMDELRSSANAIVGFEQRIEDIGRDVRAFSAEIVALAHDFGLSDEHLDPFDTLNAIEEKLARDTRLAVEADGYRARLQDVAQQEREAAEAIQLAKAELSPLMIAAKAEDPASLSEAIRRAEVGAGLKRQIEEATRSILELGDGLDLERVLVEARDADPAALVAESERLQEELREASLEIERLAELRREAFLRFKQVDDRPDAAIAAADLALARAEMEAQAEAYVRKRAEAALLGWAVERYRREKQAPLLKRASAIFSQLTLGRYASLGVDIEDGRPRLSGLRADGATVVPVTGMSEGTLDQLFLSLRLAAVEESVAGGVGLPFLADDLFINYDDERSAAGFRVLAELAQTTQVLFFTHHQHLADLARDSLGPAVVSTCALGDLKMDAA